MSATSEAIIRIDARTADMAADIASIKTTQESQGKQIADLLTHQAQQDHQIDAMQLANARLNGQLDMLKNLVLFLGLSGLAALIRTFINSP